VAFGGCIIYRDCSALDSWLGDGECIRISAKTVKTGNIAVMRGVLNGKGR
jgi:hypothetical protein